MNRQNEIHAQRGKELDVSVPITNPMTFLERVPASNSLSTSNIGIQVEPLTHAFRNTNSNYNQ